MSQVWPPALPGQSGAITDAPPLYSQYIWWNGAPIRCLPWHVACVVTTFVLVAARVLVRAKYLRGFSWDDVFLVFAWVLVAAFSATVMYATSLGFGSPLWEIPGNWAGEVEAWSTTAHALYSPAAMMLKISFLISTMYAFDSKKVRVCSWVVIAIVVITHAVTLWLAISVWVTFRMENSDGTFTICKENWIGALLAGILNTSTSAIVLLLPVISANWRFLRSASWSKITQAVVVCAVGSFCVVASGIRAGMKVRNSSSDCGIYYVNEYDPLAIWAMVELVMGLVAASLLVFSPAVERFTRPRTYPKELDTESEDTPPESQYTRPDVQSDQHDQAAAPAPVMSEKQQNIMALAVEKELH